MDSKGLSLQEVFQRKCWVIEAQGESELLVGWILLGKCLKMLKGQNA